MAEPGNQHDGREPGAPRAIHVGPAEGGEKKTNWLAWLALLAGILALLFALSQCDREDTTTTAAAPIANESTSADAATSASGGAATAAAARAGAFGAGYSELGTYLGSTEPLPRRFALERPNFDTGKSDVRAEDQPAVAELARLLKERPNARVRLIGYADARGSDPANARLGAARADAIRAALTTQGIEAGRIETASGGENDPVASNADASGRFENRRTEVEVTAR